jgi:hypothetical protein
MSERGGISLPGAPSPVPGLPENFQPIIFEQFAGLDTKALRPGIRDEMCSWCDGFMPLGPNNLRVLPGVGTPIYTAAGSLTVEWFGFGNIADTSYCLVLLSDGSAVAVNLITLAVATVMPAGTIAAPNTIFGFTQWGSQYLVLGKDQANGYWIWDGTSLFGAGTLSPEITLTAAGEGYTSSPTVTMNTTGAGSGATFNAQVLAGAVTRILVTNPGSGFSEEDFVSLSIAGGGISDAQALATATLSAGGGVTSVVITNGGNGYTYAAKLTASGTGSGAAFALNIQNGTITSVTVINKGSGYNGPPSLSFTDPGYGSGTYAISGGSGAQGYATTGSNGLLSIAVTSGGNGYTSVPQVVILGDGTGAQAEAFVAGGVVTGVTVIDPGQGYTVALVDIRGGNNAANATAILMPFGLSGTALESYVNRIWFTNGGAAAAFPPKNRTIFSIAGTPVNFDPSLGGGAFPSNDSFLRVGYHALRQSNGFLYLIGDSSLNSISGVQQTNTTTGTGATAVTTTNTTFNNQNADPQIGSPWPSSVQQFRRNVVIANTMGIHVSLGGSVEKISEPLDGFYASVGSATAGTGIFAIGENFPSAVAQIFGRYVYMILLPVIDQYTGQQVAKLLMTDDVQGRRWWTSQQDITLTFIAGQELNSILTAYGTDGKSIYPLFQKPSTGFTKTVRSKLWATPGYFTTKTTLHALGIVEFNVADEPLTFSADNEASLNASSPTSSVTLAPPAAPGLEIFGPQPIGQAGRLTGITLTTTASDVAILSLMIVGQVFSINV